MKEVKDIELKAINDQRNQEASNTLKKLGYKYIYNNNPNLSDWVCESKLSDVKKSAAINAIVDNEDWEFDEELLVWKYSPTVKSDGTIGRTVWNGEGYPYTGDQVYISENIDSIPALVDIIHHDEFGHLVRFCKSKQTIYVHLGTATFSLDINSKIKKQLSIAKILEQFDDNAEVKSLDIAKLIVNKLEEFEEVKGDE